MEGEAARYRTARQRDWRTCLTTELPQLAQLLQLVATTFAAILTFAALMVALRGMAVAPLNPQGRSSAERRQADEVVAVVLSWGETLVSLLPWCAFILLIGLVTAFAALAERVGPEALRFMKGGLTLAAVAIWSILFYAGWRLALRLAHALRDIDRVEVEIR